MNKYLVSVYCVGGMASKILPEDEAIRYAEEMRAHPNVTRVDGPNLTNTIGYEEEIDPAPGW